MTTDNTQAELDVLKYVLLKAYYQGKDGEGYSDAQIKQDKQAILDWHNKQVEAVLDRLESQSRRADDCTDDTIVVKMIRVEAERNKLKEAL